MHLKWKTGKPENKYIKQINQSRKLRFSDCIFMLSHCVCSVSGGIHILAAILSEPVPSSSLTACNLALWPTVANCDINH